MLSPIHKRMFQTSRRAPRRLRGQSEASTYSRLARLSKRHSVWLVLPWGERGILNLINPEEEKKSWRTIPRAVPEPPRVGPEGFFGSQRVIEDIIQVRLQTMALCHNSRPAVLQRDDNIIIGIVISNVPFCLTHTHIRLSVAWVCFWSARSRFSNRGPFITIIQRGSKRWSLKIVIPGHKSRKMVYVRGIQSLSLPQFK